MRLAGVVRTRAWRIEGEFAQELLPGRELHRNSFELFEIAAARRLRIQPLEVRRVPFACKRHLPFPGARRRREKREQFDERPPVLLGRCRCLPGKQRLPVVLRELERLKTFSGIDRPDAGQKLQRPLCGDAILRIVGPAQDRQKILYMRGLEKFQAAVFHVRNIAAHQLQFEQIAVMRAAKQHRLVAQLNALLARRKHSLDHVLRLGEFVDDADQSRVGAGGAPRTQIFPELLRSACHERVCDIEYGLR